MGLKVDLLQVSILFLPHNGAYLCVNANNVRQVTATLLQELPPFPPPPDTPTHPSIWYSQGRSDPSLQAMALLGVSAFSGFSYVQVSKEAQNCHWAQLLHVIPVG